MQTFRGGSRYDRPDLEGTVIDSDSHTRWSIGGSPRRARERALDPDGAPIVDPGDDVAAKRVLP
jgi:hypothetical protein